MGEKVGEIFYEVSLDTAAALNAGRDFRKEVNTTEKSLQSLDSKLSATAKAVQGFVASLAIAATIRKIVDETRKAEQEQAQLAAVLKSTGESAGWSAEQLNKMAEAMAKQSTFSAGEITQAQTRLLSYENILGEQVPAAMQATIDMAARLGTSITQSAEDVGKALNKPSEGMTSLSRKGFEFSADQIALAKKLESTGKMAEAQAIVLDALGFAYGGAAQAARNTFGGAITSLQNQLNDLLTADGASLGSATKAVNDLTTTLGSSETKAAFGAITGWVINLSRVVVTAITDIANFINSTNKLATLTGNDAFGKMKKDAEDTSAKVLLLTGRLENLGVAIERDPGNEFLKVRAEKMKAQISTLMKLGAEQSAALKTWANGVAPPEIDGPPSSAAGLTAAQIAAAAAAAAAKAAGAKAREDADKKAAREAEALRKQEATQAKEYLKNLGEQNAQVDKMTVSQRLQYDLQTGAVKLSADQRKEAEKLATAIDAAKKAEQDRMVALNYLNAGLSAQRDLLAQIDNYSQNLAGMTMSDKAVQDMQARSQIVETYLAKIRALEAEERAALAGTTDENKKAELRKQYADLIAVQQDYQTRSLAEWEKYVQERNAREGDWTTGAQKAMANYVESARNASEQANQAWTKGLQGTEDALVSLAMNGKADFKSLANSIIADLVRMQVKAQMTSLMDGKSSGGGSGASGIGFGGFMGAISSIAGMFGFADGGPTPPGGKYKAVGVVHAGENVWSQEDVRRAGGMGAVEAMRRGGRGYADGGAVGAYVGAVPSPTGSATGQGGVSVVFNPTYQIDGSADKAAAMVQMQRIAADSQKQLVEQLKRVRVIPQ